MKQKGIVHLFILAFIAVVAIAAIGYFAYQNTQQGDNGANNTNTQESTSMPLDPTSTPKEELSPTTNPTSNWLTKTYSTYQVKYPEGLKTNEQEGSIFNISMWGPTQTKDTELFDGFFITFQPKELPGVTPEDFANSQIKQANDSGLSEITDGPAPTNINNYYGVAYTEIGLGTFKNIILSSGDGVMLMHITTSVSDPGDLGFQDTVDKILSTFQFLD